MKRIVPTSTVPFIVMLICLISTSSSSSQEPTQGAYFDPNDGCNYFTFVRGDADDQAQAKKACANCAGVSCRYVEKLEVSPACFGKCKEEGNTNSDSPANKSTETAPSESGRLSFENDAACPAPDCHYESNGRGGRTCRCEIKLERKPYRQSDTQQNPTQKPTEQEASDSPSLEATIKFIQDKLGDYGTVEWYSPDKPAMYRTKMTTSLRPTGTCQVATTHRQFSTGSESFILPTDSEYKFSLGDIDPTKVSVIEDFDNGGREGYAVTLTTKGKAQKIVQRSTTYTDANKNQTKSSGVYDSDGVWLRIRTKDAAERVARALKYAVQLCEGNQKKEIF